MEEDKLKRLERSEMTKECIAGSQIRHWIGEMHVYKQKHLNVDQTWCWASKRNWWWPTMGVCDIQNFIRYDCPTCRESFQNKPHNIICGTIIAQLNNKDWRNSLIEYLTYGCLRGAHISKRQHKRIARQSREYIIEEGKLKRILSDGEIKICIARQKISEYLQELHVTESGEHLSLEMTWHLVMFGPYWWPTCRDDIKNLCNWK